MISVTTPITDPEELSLSFPETEKVIGYRKIISGGHTIIDVRDSYTETHQVHVVAHDSAGNETQSDPVTIMVIPKKEDEDEERSGSDDEAWLRPWVPDRWREEIS